MSKVVAEAREQVLKICLNFIIGQSSDYFCG